MQLIDTIRPYKALYSIAIVIFVLDQVSKLWISNHLPIGSYWPPQSIEVIQGFFYIVHIGNEGAAWGLFSGHGTWLALFAIAALCAIYCLRDSLELKRPMMQIAFGLLIGGVVGNLVDRLVHGHVIDFLDFHLPFSLPYLLEGGRYPAFNIADCGIVIGVFIYIVLSFLTKPNDAAKAS